MCGGVWRSQSECDEHSAKGAVPKHEGSCFVEHEYYCYDNLEEGLKNILDHPYRKKVSPAVAFRTPSKTVFRSSAPSGSCRLAKLAAV